MDQLGDALSKIIIPVIIAVVGWLFTVGDRRSVTRLLSDIKTAADAMNALDETEQHARDVLRSQIDTNVRKLERRNAPGRGKKALRVIGIVLLAVASAALLGIVGYFISTTSGYSRIPDIAAAAISGIAGLVSLLYAARGIREAKEATESAEEAAALRRDVEARAEEIYRNYLRHASGKG
ncbi:hypothetical protein ABC270_13305 [Curtobacterium sp. 1P10AnD]|uniref:hypothetical protein n=1 Tax=Curtobacterium sp. 1P10AnD TaxID=3132283 RepID=UPI00399F307D